MYYFRVTLSFTLGLALIFARTATGSLQLGHRHRIAGAGLENAQTMRTETRHANVAPISKKLIDAVDQDGDGRISLPEMKQALVRMNVEVPTELKQIFLHMDSDANGLIGSVELAARLKTALNQTHPGQDPWARVGAMGHRELLRLLVTHPTLLQKTQAAVKPSLRKHEALLAKGHGQPAPPPGNLSKRSLAQPSTDREKAARSQDHSWHLLPSAPFHGERIFLGFFLFFLIVVGLWFDESSLVSFKAAKRLDSINKLGGAD